MFFLDTLNIAIGGTGSGKSLLALHIIEHFLMNDTRAIVTTLAIDIGEIAEYLSEKYGDQAPTNIAARIIRIYKEDLATFWRIRGIQYDGEYGYTAKKLGRFGSEDWQIALPGVVFILDEFQVSFKAREFMKNSGEFLDYQPQARKLGDTIVGTTPASSLVDKAFRDLCNQCIVLTNMYKIRVRGFTAPRKIVARIFINCPPVKGEEPIGTHDIFIEPKKLARCYKTQEGLGVKGVSADLGVRAKGLPWWSIIPIAIGIGFVVWLVITQGMHATTRWGFRKIAISEKSNQANLSKSYQAVAPSAPPSPFAALDSTNVITWRPKPPPPPVPLRKGQARGFCVLNGVLYIDTRLGQVQCSTWTNAGDSILANGIEWSLPSEPVKPFPFSK